VGQIWHLAIPTSNCPASPGTRRERSASPAAMAYGHPRLKPAESRRVSATVEIDLLNGTLATNVAAATRFFRDLTAPCVGADDSKPT
jgi:hypothetical protein